MDERKVSQVPLFSGLGKRERRQVAKLADEVDVAEGKRLAIQGSLAYEFFAIREGTADVVIDGDVVSTLGPGDFFGEIGLLQENRLRTASVTATSPMQLVVLTGPQLRTLESDLPEVVRTIRETLEQRLAQGPTP